MQPLRVYYLDEPLSDDERHRVERTLLGPWADFKTGATSIEQRRVPMIRPTDGDHVTRIPTVRANPRRVGIEDDCGRQFAWIGPGNVLWTSTFMTAIAEETGFHAHFLRR